MSSTPSFYEFSLYKTLTTRYGDYGKGSGIGRPVTRDHSAQQQTQLCIWLPQAFFFTGWVSIGMDGIMDSGTTVASYTHV